MSNLVIPNNGTIGSVSDTDAISIASDGGLTFSGGVDNAGTISAGTIGSGVSMESSGLTVRNISQTALGSDQTVSNTTTTTELFAPTYTPKFAGSTIQFVFTFCLETRSSGGADGRKVFRIYVSSADSGFTAINWGYNETHIGSYDYGSSGVIVDYHSSVMGPLIVTSTTGVITASVRFQNDRASTNSTATLRADGTTNETYMTWIEYK